MGDKKEFEGIENTGAPRKKEIPIEMAEEAGRVYGEGRETLSNLITYCVKNGIRTFACCAGHEQEDEKGSYSRGYLSFALENEKTREAVLALFSRILKGRADITLGIKRYVNVENGKKEDRYVR